MNDISLALRGISKTYNAGQVNEIRVLQALDLEIVRGEVVALIAPSGAGKSTLLHIAGLLDSPDSGQVIVGGRDLSRAKDAERTAARRDDIGFVYQFHHLLPEFTALENIVLPQLANGVPKAKAAAHAMDLLTRVGVAERAHHRPAEISGGQQQRVAVCRALANSPKVLLADEPTGNLDPETAGMVFDALLDVVRHTGLSALIATHNPELAARMDRIVRLERGQITPA